MTDIETIQMALIGFESERLKIDNAIKAIRSQLGIRFKGVPASTVAAKTLSGEGKPKRKMSVAGRKAISEATTKRWAAFHAAKQAETPEQTAPTKAKPTVKVPLSRAKKKAAKKAAKKKLAGTEVSSQ